MERASRVRPYKYRTFWDPAIPKHRYHEFTDSEWEVAETVLSHVALGSHHLIYSSQHELYGIPILVGYYLVRVAPHIASKGWCRDVVITIAP